MGCRRRENSLEYADVGFDDCEYRGFGLKDIAIKSVFPDYVAFLT